MAELLPVLKQSWTDANGLPLAGGLLYSYEAGTTTPQATYTDATGTTPNTNPVVLDSNGQANVWGGTAAYKFVLKDSLGDTLWTVDQVQAPNGAAQLPAGGASGQVATKNSSNDFDVSWQTPAATVLGFNQLRSGSGVPSNGLGLNGDFYIDTAALNLYGPKASGSWGSPTSIIGPPAVPAVTGTRASPQLISAAGGIGFTGTAQSNIWFIKGNGGAVTITASPQIAAGNSVGQSLTVICVDGTNTVTFSDGNGLALKGPCVAGLNTVFKLQWDGTNWLETGRN